jgi:hypothetical protein
LKAISDEAYEIVTSTGGNHAGNLALGPPKSTATDRRSR